MKKLLLLIIPIFFLTACSMDYKVADKKVTFNQYVEFRHINYRTSKAFDYGSDNDFKYYNIYDKKNKIIYSVTINKIDSDMTKGIKKFEDTHHLKKKDTKKINRIKWIYIDYIEEKIEYHSYFAKYNDKEYYRIDFYNVDKGQEFEKQFMKYVTIK